MTKKMPITLTTRAEHCFCHCFIYFSIFQRLFFIFIHTLALVTIFLNNLSCICTFLFQFVFFIYPVLCHVYLCFCVIVSLCICVSVLTSPWWGCRPSRVYSGRKYRRTELIICPVLCKYLNYCSANIKYNFFQISHTIIVLIVITTTMTYSYLVEM